MSVSNEQTISNFVQQLYLTYYGRPADPGGLDFWIETFGHKGQAYVINKFGISEEYQDRFSDLSNTELVISLYQHIFSRMPDSVGLVFYAGLLDSGEASLLDINVRIINGIEDGSLDHQFMDNKTVAANTITDRIAELGVEASSEYNYKEESDRTAIDNYFTNITSDIETRDKSITVSVIDNLMIALGVLPDPDLDEIAPVFFSGTFEQKNENLPRFNPVYDAQAVDSAGTIDVGITYNLPALNEDNELFTINQASGVVYFRDIPDYENPLDSGKDNNFTILVEASDESGNTADRIVNVRILDVDETPPPFSPPGSALALLDDAYGWDSTYGAFTFNFNGSVLTATATDSSGNVTYGLINRSVVSFDFSEKGNNNTSFQDDYIFTFTNGNDLVSENHNIIVSSQNIYADTDPDKSSTILLKDSTSFWSGLQPGSYQSVRGQAPDNIFLSTLTLNPLIMPTLGSYIEANVNVDTGATVNFAAYLGSQWVGLNIPEERELATAYIFETVAAMNPVGTVTMRGIENVTVGGAGGAVIEGNSNPNIFSSYAGTGTVEFYGVGGDDTFIPGMTSSTTIDGGEGSDKLLLRNYGSSSITVDLRNTDGDYVVISAQDGSELRFKGIEIIFGTRYSDVFIGDDNPNFFNNLAGGDRMTGNGGRDSFYFFDSLPTAGTITDFNIAEDSIGLRSFVYRDGNNDLDNLQNKTGFSLQSTGPITHGLTVIDSSEAGYSDSLSKADIADYLKNQGIVYQQNDSVLIFVVTDRTDTILMHANAGGSDLSIDPNEMTPIVILTGVTSTEEFTASLFQEFS